ncbi:peptidase S10 [Planctomycetaceae bacterium SCGC AG-212-F19]|nr:peptidase S10 [Planctomycetaceae bacterium SCGC AG-212-F19]
MWTGATAQEPAPATKPKPPASKEGTDKEGAARPEKSEKLVTSRHSITVGGAKLEYEATAGTLTLKDDDGKARASMFFVAYTKVGATPAKQRPLTFAFNGGPGSSAVWLHLGVLGPKRVVLEEKGKSVAPPYRLVDNEATLLDQTDLVFIDPVSTGYSRPAAGVEAKLFHGVQEDIDSIGAFIRQYVTRFNRWESPKFLIGESYGTTRAAGLADHLQDREGISLNGIVLVSVVLNFGTIRFEEGNDLPYVLYLPGYTATAWYHKKLPADLQGDLKKALAEAEKFAVDEYAAALLKGNTLSSAEQQRVSAKLARLTGLSEDYVRRSNLRIDSSRFRKELLREERRTVGRFDSRFPGMDLDAAGDRPEYDPSYIIVQGPFTALVNDYLRNELKYESDLEYRILTDKVQPWNYGSARNRYLNTAPALRRAMTKNPGLRVLVANGIYDLATPYFATRYTFNQLGLDPSLAGNVTIEEYPAGHMMYINEASLTKLKGDVAKWLRGDVPAGPAAGNGAGKD